MDKNGAREANSGGPTPQLYGPGTEVSSGTGSWSPTLRHTQFARLSLLLLKQGTEAVASYVKMQLAKGSPLSQVLQIKCIEKALKKLKRKALISRQLQTLYPIQGEVDENKMDLTLWFLVGRVLSDQGNLAVIQWDKEPGEDDDLPQHHMIRLKNIRNIICHRASQQMEQLEFENMWDSVSTALAKLGSLDAAEVEKYKTCDMDPISTKQVTTALKVEALEDAMFEVERRASNRKRIFISVIISLCVLVAVLVTTLLSLKTLIHEPACPGQSLEINTGEILITFMSRSAWGAKKPRRTIQPFHEGVEYMITTQTSSTEKPSTEDAYCKLIQKIQDQSMGSLADIAFSYLIGDNGVVYEGRGHYYIPATAWGYNYRSMSSAFIGTFQYESPSPAALMVAEKWISYMVEKNNLVYNATVYGLCQVSKNHREAPGHALMEVMIKQWHFQDWSWRDYNLALCENA